MKCLGKLTTCRKCKERLDGRSDTCPHCGEDARCQKAVVPGYNYCDVHGAPAPGRNFYGKGAPIVSGSGSSFPLVRLASKYKEMQKDGALLSNRQAIDIIDERVVQLLERIDVDEAPERMERLYNLWQDYRAAKESRNTTEVIILADKIDKEFEKVYHDYKAWEQMFTALEVRRRHVESEVKILKDIHAVMTAEDAYEMVAKLMAAVITAVDDPKTIKRIQYEFTRIVGDVSDDAATRLERETESSSGEDGDSL